MRDPLLPWPAGKKLIADRRPVESLLERPRLGRGCLRRQTTRLVLRAPSPGCERLPALRLPRPELSMFPNGQSANHALNTGAPNGLISRITRPNHTSL